VDLRLLAGASHRTDTGRRKGGPPAGDLQGLHLSIDFVAAARFHVKHRRTLGTRSAPRGRHIRTEDPGPTADGPRSAVMVGMTIYLAPIARCLRRIAAFRGGQRLGQAPVRASMAHLGHSTSCPATRRIRRCRVRDQRTASASWCGHKTSPRWSPPNQRHTRRSRRWRVPTAYEAAGVELERPAPIARHGSDGGRQNQGAPVATKNRRWNVARTPTVPSHGGRVSSRPHWLPETRRLRRPHTGLPDGQHETVRRPMDWP
jgi:hypothetical protein